MAVIHTAAGGCDIQIPCLFQLGNIPGIGGNIRGIGRDIFGIRIGLRLQFVELAAVHRIFGTGRHFAVCHIGDRLIACIDSVAIDDDIAGSGGRRGIGYRDAIQRRRLAHADGNGFGILRGGDGGISVLCRKVHCIAGFDIAAGSCIVSCGNIESPFQSGDAITLFCNSGGVVRYILIGGIQLAAVDGIFRICFSNISFCHIRDFIAIGMETVFIHIGFLSHFDTGVSHSDFRIGYRAGGDGIKLRIFRHDESKTVARNILLHSQILPRDTGGYIGKAALDLQGRSQVTVNRIGFSIIAEEIHTLSSGRHTGIRKRLLHVADIGGIAIYIAAALHTGNLGTTHIYGMVASRINGKGNLRIPVGHGRNTGECAAQSYGQNIAGSLGGHIIITGDGDRLSQRFLIGSCIVLCLEDQSFGGNIICRLCTFGNIIFRLFRQVYIQHIALIQMGDDAGIGRTLSIGGSFDGDGGIIRHIL